jgi:hypothetical protein
MTVKNLSHFGVKCGCAPFLNAIRSFGITVLTLWNKEIFVTKRFCYFLAPLNAVTSISATRALVMEVCGSAVVLENNCNQCRYSVACDRLEFS